MPQSMLTLIFNSRLRFVDPSFNLPLANRAVPDLCMTLFPYAERRGNPLDLSSTSRHPDRPPYREEAIVLHRICT